ncbi:hypothetical protein BDZ45DRAFT_778837 [Acephala macrosclerotiorum]|nr:hypothetical protein BDZ45DRAFT_778837 [Acephala macrosclerotiorum]
MLFVQRTTLFIALLSQLVLCALPPKQYQGNTRYVDVQPEDGIGGIYPGLGTGMSYSDMGNLAKAALDDAIAMAIAQNDVEITTPRGVSVYISGNRDLIIGAIGAGTGNHGEQNVQIFCQANRLEFDGGKMVTYVPSKGGFIGACTPNSGPDTRNCFALLERNGITDVFKLVKASTPARRDADRAALEFEA